MSNVKSKISLGFVMLLIIIMSLGSVALAAEKIYIPVNLTVKDSTGNVLKNGTDLGEITPGTKITATAYCDKEIALLWSQNPNFMADRGYKFNDKGMALLGYMFDCTDSTKYINSSDPTQMTITIPELAEGVEHYLVISAVAACDGLPEGDKEYEASAGTYALYFKIKKETAPETTIKASISKVNDTTVKATATVTNGTFSKMTYSWDGAAEKTVTTNPTNITVPTAVGTHKLTVKAYTTNGKTATATYSVTVAAPTTPETTVKVAVSKVNDTTLKATATVTNGTFSKMTYSWDGAAEKTVTTNPTNITVPTAVGTHKLTVKAYTTNGKTATTTYTFTVAAPVPVDDELIVEPWMKEDNSMKELAVSLRNDSDEYEKGNKNFYALNEEVVYYVDYKNGGDDITKAAKLVLELPLDFKVIDAFGGTVDAKEGTITWNFPDGIEEDYAGTKVVKVAYTGFERSSKKYEIVYPVADIYERNKVVDSSAVINYIFKNEDTEITDEHYPYMFGDQEKPTFRPDDTITRAEGALVLTRIFGIDYSGTKIDSTFSDIGETYLEAQKAIVAATKLGLINGYEDGTYKPNKEMTKAEFMKIIASYIELNAENEDIRGLEVKEDTNIKIYKNPKTMYVTGTTTVNQHWASDWVTMLVRLNMTPVSSSDKNLELDEKITRAEVAQLVNFYLLRAPADVDSSTKTQFSDVSKRHELFEDIVEATRGEHTYTLSKEGYELAVEED